MTENELFSILDGMGRPRVLIVGDLILDRYVSGDVSRISPEAPIPVLAARAVEERLGGAGNVAANLRAMEAEVEVVGVLGGDSRGSRFLTMLGRIGVECSGCPVDEGRPTTQKTRLVCGSQQMLRIDWEEARPISFELARRLADGLPERVARADAVVLSDYGKGALPPLVIEAAIRAARERGVPCLVDPKGADYTRYRGATLVTPNKLEAELAIGRAIPSLEDLPRAALELVALAELDAAVVTLGAEGMFHLTAGGRGAHVPTVARAVFDVTGAGDTVIAHLALGLGAGVGLETSVHLANHAAGIVVGRRGAASVTRRELREALGDHTPDGGKILRPDDLARAVVAWRAQGKRIALTNGCFDILHAGHVDALRFARAKGDLLLVGVNDDASVRRLKGEGRPVNALEDRLHVLAALECVDAVVPFAEDTPAKLVETVTPDALVKSEDWREKGVVGREWVERHGGAVHLAPLTPGRSTTSVLRRAGGGGRDPSPGSGAGIGS